LLAPASYQGAAAVATVLAVNYGLMFFGKQPQLVFAKKTGVITIIGAVTLALTVGANLLLIPRLGALGAAFAALLAGAISTGLFLVVSQQYYRIAFEFRKLALMYGLVVFGAVVALLSREVGAPYALRLTAKLVVTAAFILLGIRLGIISRMRLRTLITAFDGRVRVEA
jgi:hypothetical protein